MRYFLLDLSASSAPEYCFCAAVEGGQGAELLISHGEPAAHVYPPDLDEVLVHLDVEHRGLKLPTRLGNTQQLLMLSNVAFAALNAEIVLGRCDRHPFLLINHKGRIHSRDYSFVNPLEQRAIAHEAARFERFESTGRIYDCEEWVLDSSKLEGAPDLLRSAELPYEYFASERFVAAATRLDLSNFAFIEVEHR